MASKTDEASSKLKEVAVMKRFMQKLDDLLASKNFYEAHQVYRAIYNRCTAKKQFHELLKILYDGSLLLLEAGQLRSGEDLCKLYVETLVKDSVAVSDSILNQLGSLLTHMLSHGNALDHNAFIFAAVEWSKTVHPEYNRGHPDLHKRFARILWRCKFYALARYHFFESNDGESCASFLIEYHLEKGYPSELDMFPAQAVFQYLCRSEKQTARNLFFGYTEGHPYIRDGPPFVLPLLNFVWLLLDCIETRKVSTFRVLVQAYQQSLSRDPIYMKYVNRIGEIFFGLSFAKSSSFNIVESIMKGLLNDEPEEPKYSRENTKVQGSDDSKGNEACLPQEKNDFQEEGLD